MGKGEGFERDMCRVLSLWWTIGDRDDVFWRNRLRKTQKSSDAKHQLGDVVALDPIGAPLTNIFNIELKTGYSKRRKGKRVKNVPWDLLDLVDSRGDPVLVDFWKQTVKDATLSYRYPLLIFKRDYHRPVVVMDKQNFLFFEKYQGIFAGRWLQGFVQVDGKSNYLVFVSWAEFSEWLQPACVKMIYEKYFSKGK